MTLVLVCILSAVGSWLYHLWALHEWDTFTSASRCANSFYRQCHSVRQITIVHIQQGTSKCEEEDRRGIEFCGDYSYLTYHYGAPGSSDTDLVRVSTHDIPTAFQPGHHAVLDRYGTTDERLKAGD